MPRRPHLTPLRLGLALAVTALAATACSSGPVDVVVSATDATTLATCTDFAQALPTALDDLTSREVSPSDAPARAYGDPAVVVSCGGALPADFGPGASCEVANGVGWYVPQNQYDDQAADVTLTAVGYRPVVSVVVPHQYRPSGVAAVIAELADDVKTHLTLKERCT